AAPTEQPSTDST
ncbi:hypothetical protein AB1N83_011242, partial [Pleurotus pulmonarius]